MAEGRFSTGPVAWFSALPRTRRWAMLASAVWAVVVIAYATGYVSVAAASETRALVFLDGLLFLLALVLPLLVAWLATYLAEELARQREIMIAMAEFATPLIQSLEATRTAVERHRPAEPDAIAQAVQEGVARAGRGETLAGPVERIAAAQARLQAALDGVVARLDRPAAPCTPAPAEERRTEPRPKPAPDPAPPATEQPTLPMMPVAESADRLAWDDLVRALDFPRDASDREGFRALKAALRHRALAQMLQAAEDVLNMLSQQGIYVDDLEATPGDPDQWRRFIAGTRGSDVAGIGGISDPEALETTRALLRSDPIFRDTALFFQRRFDTVLGDHAATASDEEIARIADTRSGRAFTLLARLSGALG